MGGYGVKERNGGWMVVDFMEMAVMSANFRKTQGH